MRVFMPTVPKLQKPKEVIVRELNPVTAMDVRSISEGAINVGVSNPAVREAQSAARKRRPILAVALLASLGVPRLPTPLPPLHGIDERVSA